MRLRYPAAYDNLGWLIEKENPSKAVELFRNGVRLGDPDAMVSLAEMIDKGRTVPLNQSETKLALMLEPPSLEIRMPHEPFRLNRRRKYNSSSKEPYSSSNRGALWRCSKEYCGAWSGEGPRSLRQHPAIDLLY